MSGAVLDNNAVPDTLGRCVNFAVLVTWSVFKLNHGALNLKLALAFFFLFSLTLELFFLFPMGGVVELLRLKVNKKDSLHLALPQHEIIASLLPLPVQKC